MDRDLEGALAGPNLVCYVAIGATGRFAGEECFHGAELVGTSGMLPFLAETSDDPIEQCQCPVTLIDMLWGLFDGGLELEPAFGVSEIERKDGLSAAATLRPGVVAF